MESRAVPQLCWWRWGIAWGGLFLGLLWVFPGKPSYRFPLPGAFHRVQFADPQTAIVFPMVPREVGIYTPAGPLEVVDLPSRRIVRIALPDEQDVVRTESEEAREVVTPTGWSLSYVGTIREFIVVTMEQGQTRGRLHLLNRRTGEEIARRDVSGKIAGVLADRILLQPSGMNSSNSSIELLEIPSLRPIACPLPAHLKPWSLSRSPDGRFVVEQLEDIPQTDSNIMVVGADGRAVPKKNADGVRVWNIDSGMEQLAVPGVNLAVFSADSRLLASLRQTGWRHQSGVVQIWQVHDLETGSLLTERTIQDHQYHIDSLSFHDGDQALVGYLNSSGFRSGPPGPDWFRKIDVWRWKEGRTHECFDEARDFIDGEGKSSLGRMSTPRFVSGGDGLLDVASDKLLYRMNEDESSCAVSSDGRWGVIEDESDLWSDRAAWALNQVWAKVRWSAFPRRTWLIDLASGKKKALLSRDRVHASFSPGNEWLAVDREGLLEIWHVVPVRPVMTALLWSLVVPGAALFRAGLQWRRANGKQ